MKKTVKRLTLRRETVVALEPTALAEVAGGLSIPLSYCRSACHTCISICFKC
jgi:hypothetical protein